MIEIPAICQMSHVISARRKRAHLICRTCPVSRGLTAAIDAGHLLTGFE